MSTDEEIQQVFEQDIANKTKQVLNKFGNAPFYDYFVNMPKDRIYRGVMSGQDEEFLKRLARIQQVDNK